MKSLLAMTVAFMALYILFYLVLNAADAAIVLTVRWFYLWPARTSVVCGAGWFSANDQANLCLVRLALENSSARQERLARTMAQWQLLPP